MTLKRQSLKKHVSYIHLMENTETPVFSLQEAPPHYIALYIFFFFIYFAGLIFSIVGNEI